MKKELSLLILILVLIINLIYFLIYYEGDIFGNAVIDFEKNEKGFVSKIIDGDTVVINGESVRLLGIDSDERGEPCYAAAKKRISELILNKEVILEKDTEDKDQYKRLLRYLWLEREGEKINVNLKMVEEGLAVARFYESQKYKNQIVNAEKSARDNGVGCKWENLADSQ